ncbi:hypothetical protein BJP42_08790 [Candidatus Williamhamiltonella defendens]|nr:hypothetical protein BJP42_08790 [Candidatus Hamiltonella defensa]
MKTAMIGMTFKKRLQLKVTLNCNIVELDSLPEGAENNGEWIFDDHQVLRGTYTEAERTRQAAREKEKWMDRASKAIGPLAAEFITDFVK